ncbi:MAG: hypothetical protein ACR2RF_16720 [Geminicoccaceae bacterium]
MTITLPYPTPQGQNLADNDAGNGVNAAPVGAQEGNATATVNDIQRYDKTAIKQGTENTLAINAAIGDMAEQDSTAVSITGGTIGAGVSVAEAVNAQTVAGLTLQQLYDLEYPVGEGMKITLSNTPPVPWTGVTATWTRVGDNRFPKLGDGVLAPGDEFAGVSETDPTVLTTAQLPQHTHGMFGNEVTTSTGTPSATDQVARGFDAGGSSTEYRMRPSSLVADVGESGAAGSGIGHTHTYQNNPPFYRVVLYLRTA